MTLKGRVRYGLQVLSTHRNERGGSMISRTWHLLLTIPYNDHSFNLVLPRAGSSHNVRAGDRVRNAVGGRQDEVRFEDRAPAERLTVEHDQHLPGVRMGRVLGPAPDNPIHV